MGWHYILKLKCTILPEYLDFIEKRYLDTLFNPYLDEDYVMKPHRNYHSDDERAEEDKKMYEEWVKEEEDEQNEREKTYEGLSKFYKDLIDIWVHLRIGTHFYKYELSGNQFECEISKKVNWHNGPSGCLRQDYETFLKDVIIPLTSRINYCEIESDDYGDMRWYYTDAELRGVTFRLENKIKRVEHVYNSDGTEIIESRIIYKHSIPQHQFIDLNRCYGIF